MEGGNVMARRMNLGRAGPDHDGRDQYYSFPWGRAKWTKGCGFPDLAGMSIRGIQHV